MPVLKVKSGGKWIDVTGSVPSSDAGNIDLTEQIQKAESAAAAAEAAASSANTAMTTTNVYRSNAKTSETNAANSANRSEIAANRAEQAVSKIPASGVITSVNGVAPDENGNVEINIPDSGGNVDLTGYATEQYVKDYAQPKGEYLTAVPEGYAKTTDIPTKPEDIGAQPSGNYALKTEIPSVPVQSVNGKTGAVQLSAADVKARPENWMPSAQEVGALPSTYTPPNQTAEQVGADPKGTAASAVSQHNASADSHGDIRLELKSINDRLTAFFDSDNQTLDELSEIVAYITSNKSLIDSITTSKVSVADIVNNLTSNVSNKPLSAAQGVVLKGLIDTLSSNLANYQPKGDYALRSELPNVPTKLSAFTNDSGFITGYAETDPTVPAWAKQSTKPSYSKSEVGLGNVDNVQQYSASNPPPYPVTSVNGKTGAVSLTIPTVPTKVSAFENDKGYLTQHQDISGKVDKNKLTLGVHTDGLIYVFVDGQPVGNGVELPTGGIDGYVDSDKNIVVRGLPDGSYKFYFEMEDGSLSDGYDLVKDSNVYYTVTNNLTNCTNSNSATQAIGGQSYSATITAKSGYELKTVTVTMGGSPVSVSGGNINITNVTGNIVITAVAEESKPAYTNLATSFQEGYRLNSSGATVQQDGRTVCLDYIKFERGDVVRVKGFSTAANVSFYAFYDSTKKSLAASSHNFPGENGSKTIKWEIENGNVLKYTNVSNTGVFLMRYSGVLTGTTNDVIITVNEEIV